MENIRMRVFVTGLVQGVFFRASTASKAEEIGGITGYVQNLSDGRVEVVAEGDKHKIEKLRQWLLDGPQYARVDNLDVSHETPTGTEPAFRVIRRKT